MEEPQEPVKLLRSCFSRGRNRNNAGNRPAWEHTGSTGCADAQSEARIPCVRAVWLSKTDSAVLPRNAPAALSPAKHTDWSSPK